MGGGRVLEDISRSGPNAAPIINYAVGCASWRWSSPINVFFEECEGCLGECFQTIMFLLFGAVGRSCHQP